MRAAEISKRLSASAENVCRYYLSNGRKNGRYWTVGNAHNEKGKSLFVRLGEPGIIGNWQDGATGEYGDLLDLIQHARCLPDLADAMIEAKRFLRFAPKPALPHAQCSTSSSYTGLARRLFAASRPLQGALGEVYLNKRGLTHGQGMGALRFHPRAWFAKDIYLPAIFAAVCDNAGSITGIHRFFLDNQGNLIERRALGRLNGFALRLGPRAPVHLIVGEGFENTKAYGQLYNENALAATLCAAHMAAFIIPCSVRILTIAADNDPEGHRAAAKLQARAIAQGVSVRIHYPKLGDFNDDLFLKQSPTISTCRH